VKIKARIEMHSIEKLPKATEIKTSNKNMSLLSTDYTYINNF